MEVPPGATLAGRHVTLVPLDAARDGDGLYDALHSDGDPRLWDYLPSGPFTGPDGEWAGWLAGRAASTDPMFYVLADPADGTPRGMGSYLRIDAANGVIETGHLAFGTHIQRTPATTEAIYLLARHVFDDLGYRRFEWKCNALNARSRAAALRLGFSFEGVFRQHLVVKGRNRDTAWFAMTDGDWPVIRAAFEAWLAPANFDADGCQRATLTELRAP